MSLSATYPGVSRDPRSETRILLLLIWSATVFSYLYMTFGAGNNNLSTDDAMRLVEVRDFLAGQGWFDLTQYRLNPPNGVATHWSRLIDLPLTLLIKAGEMLLPAALAERIATIVWPAALLLVFLAGVSRLARELAGDTAARLALIFAALIAPVLQHFRPGAIDHHNAQLVLLVWSVALFAHLPARPRDTAIAGVLCALSIAIGQEMAPAVAALATVVALRWVVDGDRGRHTTVAFAVSLAGGIFVLATLTVTPAHYLTVDCDAISIAQVGVAGLGGFGLATLAMLPRLTSITRRLAAVGGLGARPDRHRGRAFVAR